MRNLVKSQVKNAFRVVGNLATDVVFTNKSVTGYDYEEDALIKPVQDEKTSVKCIVLSKEMREDSSVMLIKLLADSQDILNPDIYDTVEMDGFEWKITPPYKDNGYTIEFTVTRSI
jgi:hypothetical protein